MSLKLYSPFEILINLINAEYPKIDADIYFSDTLDALGRTFIPDNYDTPEIYINANNSIIQSFDIIAHEVAHVINPDDEHGERWKDTYDKIHKKYLKVEEEGE